MFWNWSLWLNLWNFEMYADQLSINFMEIKKTSALQNILDSECIKEYIDFTKMFLFFVSTFLDGKIAPIFTNDTLKIGFEIVIYLKHFLNFQLFFFSYDPKTKKPKFPKLLGMIWNFHTSLRRVYMYLDVRLESNSSIFNDLQSLEILKFGLFLLLLYHKTFISQFRVLELYEVLNMFFTYG